MKRKRFLKHLKQHGCVVVEEGRDHTKVLNPANGRRSIVGRHAELEPNLVRGTCKQLDIPMPDDK